MTQELWPPQEAFIRIALAMGEKSQQLQTKQYPNYKIIIQCHLSKALGKGPLCPFTGTVS